MKKVQRTYSAEFKREAVQLAQTSGKSIAQVPVNWASPTPPFISGARNWLLMVLKRFQAVGIRRPKKRNYAASSASWR